LITGSTAHATGFLSKIHNVEGVVTNLHVLEVMGDDQKLTVTSLNGGALAVQGVIGAKGADIALLRMVNPTGTPPVLALATDVFHSAKIGDKVVVVGNRQGAGVVTQVNGQIDGIGPGRIEVNAPFQAGNSGSPIFDLTTQQVIGVATYNQVMLVDVLGNQAASAHTGDPGVKQEVRWFGYRIDSVANWENIDLTEWQRELKRVEDFRTVCVALRSCAQAQFAAAKAGDPHLLSLIEKYEGQPGWVDIGTSTTTTLSKPSADLVRRLFQEVHAYAEQGVKEFGNGTYYDYFHTCVYAGNNVDILEKFRALEIKVFEEADTNFQSYQARLKQ
jgi:serine protease Do